MIGKLLNVTPNLLRLAQAGLGLLFPPRCLSCGTELFDNAGSQIFCPDCLDRLSPEVWHGCRRCAGQMPTDVPCSDHCPRCKNVRLNFDATVTLGSYRAGLNRVILRMKRPYHDAVSKAMGRLLAQRRRELLLEHRPDVIVPIPMFWRRRLVRGTNSAEVLARCLHRSLSIPMCRDVLVRHRNTLPQADLPPSKRFLNLRDAFSVAKPQAVENARVLLVDDVLTTGATCSEAAKVLKKSGAAQVFVAVVARAQGRQ